MPEVMSSVPSTLLHRMFEAQAAKTPQNPALQFQLETPITYDHLNKSANRLARHIKDACPDSQGVVGLCLEKSPLLIVALLAVLKADMTWLPIPFDAPRPRIEHILGVKPVLVFASRATVHIVAPSTIPPVLVDELVETVELQSRSDVNLEGDNIKPNDLCHILFTSGSTGVPKGVMIEHRAVAHNVVGLTKLFNLDNATRTFQFAAYTFDVFTLDLFMTFFCGGCVVLVPPATILGEITKFMNAAKVTYAHLTPTTIGFINAEDIRSLDVLASSGEPLTAKLVRRWKTRVRFINAYGPTETIVCTTQEMSDDIDPACIGQPLPGLEVALLEDGSEQEVKEGQVGEICVAGPQLFRGYLGRPCEESFFYHAGNLFYRTGDFAVAQTNPPSGDKSIRYIGRKDGQIKVHGIRVDLAEIENEIAFSSTVSHSVVVLPQEGLFREQLNAVITLKTSEDLSSTEFKMAPLKLRKPSPVLKATLTRVRNRLEQNLPPHAVPSRWWLVEQLPLTSSGKVHRTSIRSWLENMEESAYHKYLMAWEKDDGLKHEPFSPLEQRLQKLWCQILKLPPSAIGRETSFFELGADSVTVIRFVAKAREQNLSVSFQQVFQDKTIERLAASSSTSMTPSNKTSSPPEPYSLSPADSGILTLKLTVADQCGVFAEEIEDIYPCTELQKNLMASTVRNPTSYVCRFDFLLKADVDIRRFRCAWHRLTLDEPVLRNRIVHEPSSQSLLQVTVRQSESSWTEDEFNEPMSMGSSLCRHLLTMNEFSKEWQFSIKMHHALFDGWSMDLMLEKVNAIYHAENPYDISFKGPPFSTFIKYLVEDDHENAAAHLAFWKSYLDGVARLDFPKLISATLQEPRKYQVVSHIVTGNLRHKAVSLQVTPATILYGASSIVLGRHADSDDVVLGVTLSGRGAPINRIEEMIGPTFVTIPMRIQIKPDETVSQFLKVIETHVIRSTPHQHHGLQGMREANDENEHACQFSCLVIVQLEDENASDHVTLLERTGCQTPELLQESPLSLEFQLRHETVAIHAHFDTSILSSNDVRVVLGHLEVVIGEMVMCDPSFEISRIPVASEDELSKILTLNRQCPPLVNRCVHELVQAKARQIPGHIAIYEQSSRLEISYLDLDQISSRLATVLAAQYRVGSPMIMPVAFEKSAMAIITMLAVLKTGAAYVCLDPSHPKLRHQDVLEDTGAEIILCSSETKAIFTDLVPQVVEVNDTWLGTSVEVRCCPCSYKPSDLAHVIYTSGSTGKPKGIALSHSAISTSVSALAQHFNRKPKSRVLQFSSFTFDMSLSDIYVTLLSGGCICLPTEHDRLNNLPKVMKNLAIDAVFLTPSVASLINPEDVPYLSHLVVGGEAVPRSLIETWASKVTLMTVYGPSEVTISSNATTPLSVSAEPDFIGDHVTGISWVVQRDRLSQIVMAPLGCAGEIAISGHALGNGYVGLPEKTKQQFIDAPALVKGCGPSRIYLTGDVGRYHHNGQIRISGRKDQQVKINGIRIELSETEHHLRQLGDIFKRSIVDCVRTGVDQSLHLVAFVCVCSDRSNDQERSRLILTETPPWFDAKCLDAQISLFHRLPRPFVPRIFVPITHIPATTSHKTNRKRLVAAFDEEIRSKRNFFVKSSFNNEDVRPPQTKLELALASVWQDVFGYHLRPSLTSSFFEAGGDSLRAIKIVNALRAKGFNLSVAQIYMNPTFASMARNMVELPFLSSNTEAQDPRPFTLIDPKRAVQLKSEAAQLCRVNSDLIEDIYPLSPYQEGLAALLLKDASSGAECSAYVAEILYSLPKHLELIRFESALQAIISKNAIYRTRLVHTSEGSLQVVCKPAKALSHYISQSSSTYTDVSEGRMLFRYSMINKEDEGSWFLRLNIHHSLYDGWTLDMFMSDLIHNYNNPGKERDPRRGYVNFIQHLSRLNEADSSAYWERQLDDAPCLQFPPKPHPNHTFKANCCHEISRTIPLDGLTHAGFSVATTMIAAWGLLLSRYCNVDDVVFGTVLSGRDVSMLENIAGPTISTVPMRIQLEEGKSTVREFLDSTQQTLLKMREHQHYGVQRISRLRGDGPRNACQFATLVVMQHRSDQKLAEQQNNFNISMVKDMTQMFVNYGLVLSSEPDTSTGEHHLRIEYDEKCVEHVQVRRMLSQLHYIVLQLATVKGPLHDIVAITREDVEEIEIWNSSISTPPMSDICLHQLFEETAYRYPNSPAIESTTSVCGIPRKLSYQELNKYSTRLARWILKDRVPSPLVVLCLKPSTLMVIAMIAISKAGRAFVPVEPSTPPSRLYYILDDLGEESLVLTESDDAHLFEGRKFEILNDSVLLSNNLHSCAPLLQVSCNDLAYVIYTSGSTGTPKGVAVAHRAITRALRSIVDTYELSTETRVLQYASFTFDASLVDIWGSFIAGSCICLLSEDERHGDISTAAAKLKANLLHLTPTVAGVLEPLEHPNISKLILGGEPVSHDLVAKWYRGGIQIINGYGPTEACIACTVNKDVSRTSPRNIGRGIACKTWITDSSNVNRLAPIGAVGELVISGDVLAEGYYGDVEKTAKKFGQDPPWLKQPVNHSTRYYRTGDLVKYNFDGSIIFVGRNDIQIKIRGQRVEPCEIETQIMRFGEFTGSIVDLLADGLLAAFVQMKDTHSAEKINGTKTNSVLLPLEVLSEESMGILRKELLQALPTRLIPSVFIPVSSFPMSKTGKVDRRALRGSAEAVLENYQKRKVGRNTRARTPSEEIMGRLWADAIPITPDKIGLDDDFFLLGGDSVAVIRLLSAARKKKVVIDLHTVYQRKSLAEMSISLQASTEEHIVPRFSLIKASGKENLIDLASKKCSVSKSAIQDIYPCTPMQEGLMALSVKIPGSYSNRSVFRIGETVSLQRLLRALKSVWARNAILRSRIVLDETFTAFQAVIDESLEVTIMDGNIERLEDLDLYIPTQYGRRLCRFVILKNSLASHLVFFHHHAITDGWSMQLLVEDIKSQYKFDTLTEQNILNNAMPLFARYVNIFQATPDAVQYWQDVLADASITLFPRGSSKKVYAANQVYETSAKFTGRIDAALLEAAWGFYLGRITESDDVCFGVIRSGRTVPVSGIETLIAPTMTSFPKRLRPSDPLLVQDYLEKVRSSGIQDSRYEHYGIRNIRKLSKSADLACDFHSLLVVQPQTSFDKDQQILLFEPKYAGNMTSSYCLTVECMPNSNNELCISLLYDEEVMSTDEVRWIAHHFLNIVNQFTQQPRKCLRDIEICTEEDKKKFLDWNNVALERIDRRMDVAVHESAIKWPELPAIDAHDAKLSYSELDRLSSNLAIQLQRLGVGSAMLVPICMEKSSAMIITMLSILKAGGGYVPLGIDHPQERLAHIVGEIDAKIVLCSPAQKTLCEYLKIPLIYLIDFPSVVSLPVNYSSISNGKPSDLAYVLYTSGSTGTPKGVMLEHHAVVTTMLAQAQRIEYQCGTRTLQFCAYTFDSSIMEIWMTLIHGGCLCIPSEKERLANLAEFIVAKKIEFAILTPTVITEILRTPQNVPCLSTLVAAGEVLTQHIVDEWGYRVRLINDYGPTETCVDAIMNTTVHSGIPPTNIGFPILTHCWVVDKNDMSKLAPIGFDGQLLISGPTLARGYLNDKGKTSKAFVSARTLEWAPQGYQTFYNTGDVVHWNTDGSITFVGRKDLQVKLHGLRIEIGDIEHALTKYESVTGAVVEVVTEKNTGFDALMAVVTLEGYAETSHQLLLPDDDLRSKLNEAFAKLRGSLPRYMIPNLLLPIGRIPITTNGKVDRSIVRSIYTNSSSEELAAFRTAKMKKRKPSREFERVLQKIWTDILGLSSKSIGLDDDFIILGGDSIDAIRMSSICRDQGFQLDVVSIFQHPTLQDMALAMRRVENPTNHTLQYNQDTSGLISAYGARAARACNVNLADVEEVLICTPLQISLMAATIRTPSAYVAREVYRLAASVDLLKFKAAWRMIHELHAIYRARIFQTEDTNNEGQMLQAICREGFDWSESTCRSLHCREAEVEEMTFGKPLVRYRCVHTDEGVYFELIRHHSIFDGWDSTLIFEDLIYAYTHSSPPPSRPPYRNYILYLQSQDRDITAAYWTATLQGYTYSESFPPLPPAGFPPKTTAVKILSSKARLKKFGRFTFPIIARAAWAILISLRSRSLAAEHDVCFLTTVSGRTTPIPGIERTIGPTMATVPVRIQVNQDESIASFLSRINKETVNMMPFEHFGLANIQRLSAAARQACNSQNLLVVQPVISGEPTNSIGLTRIAQASSMVQPFGMVMECTLKPDKNEICFNTCYEPRVISEQDVCQVQQLYLRIVEVISDLQSSEIRIGSAVEKLVSESDFEEMLTWNRPIKPPSTFCLHELVGKSTKCLPYRTAIHSHNGSLSYKELDQASNAVANTLREKYQIGPEKLVPVCIEKSSNMVVAILGILKAGGAYVPLDPSHPRSRLDYIIRETRSAIVLISEMQRSCFVGLKDAEVVLLPSQIHKEDPSTPPKITSQVNNAAYVIYTSGSTGSPKGVVVEHGAAALSVLEHGLVFGHDQAGGVRTLQFCSYTFDVSVVDIFSTLAYGGCICIPNEEERLTDLEGVISRMNVDLAILTPTVSETLDPAKLPALSSLCMTGEVLSSSLIRKWTSKQPPMRRIINGYGPTEASVDCTSAIVIANSAPNNIGRPMGGQIWIVKLDDHTVLMPIGCVGELVISGSILARGYLNDSARTDAAFVTDAPWMKRVQVLGRIYKTGDVARFLSDGSIEYLGRKDNRQVKLHGIRIEFGEIEAMIRSYGNVGVGNVAVGKVNIAGSDSIAGFLQILGYESDTLIAKPTADIKKTLSNIVSSLQADLPEYMIPKVMIPVSIWPRTASGKTDRQLLISSVETLSASNIYQFQRDSEQSCTEDDLAASKDLPSIRMVEKLWHKVLKGDGKIKYQLTDNFFRVGGDSISAIMLAGQFRHQNLYVSVQEIYEVKTLGGMARLIGMKDGQHMSHHLIPRFALISEHEIDNSRLDIANQLQLSPNMIEDLYPTSPLQEGLMALSAKSPGSYQYRNIYRLPQATDQDRLTRAINEVIAKNEILRTRIVFSDVLGSLQVVVSDTRSVWRDGTCEPDVLGYGTPLCQFGIALQKDEMLLFIDAHHAAYDGWSFALILNDIRDAYFDCLSHDGYTPYNHFISSVSATVSSQVTRLFWRDYLKGAHLTEFPEISKPSNGIFHALACKKVCLKNVRASVEAISLATMLKAAWAIVTSRYTRSDDVLFGVVLTGRNISVTGIEQITGPTAATLPLRVKLQSQWTSKNLLESVHSQLIGLIPHQHFGLQNLSGICNEACHVRSLLVVHLEQEKLNEETEKFITLKDFESERGVTAGQPYPLILKCTIRRNSNIDVEWWFDPDVLPPQQMELVSQQYIVTIHHLTNNSDMAIGDISIFSAYDLDLLRRWSVDPSPTYRHVVDFLLNQCVLPCNFDKSYVQLSIVKPDDHSQLIPVGCIGEAIFSKDPLCFDSAPLLKVEQAHYSTEQLARYRFDGTIELLGHIGRLRPESQNMDLQMIEKAIKLTSPGTEVLVEYAHKTAKEQPEIVAFVVYGNVDPVNGILMPWSKELAAVAQEMQNSIKNILPKSLLPKNIILISKVPFRSNGGVDREALKDLYVQSSEYSGDSTSSNSSIMWSSHELIMRKLWAELFHCSEESVQKHHNFFHNGGDSISVIKLVSMTTKRGYSLTAAHVYAEPKLEELSKFLDKDRLLAPSATRDPAPFSMINSEKKAVLRLRDEAIEDIFPASSMQQACLIEGQTWHQSYYAWFFVDIEGEISQSCMQLACRKLMRRHMILRTTFHQIGRECYQLVRKEPQLDFRVLQARDTLDESISLIAEDVPRPVQFGRVMTRFRLVRLPDGNISRLGIGLSHAQYDGLCINTILKDLRRSYLDDTDSWEKSPSHSRYISHLLQNANRPETCVFWKDMLRGSMMTNLIPHNTYRTGHLDHRVIRKLPRYSFPLKGKTPAVVFRAAWSLVVSILSGSDDVVFGTLVSGRNASFEGAQEMVGLCINIVPARAQLSSCRTFMDLVQHTHDQQASILPYETTPFEQIIHHAGWLSPTHYGSVFHYHNIGPMAVTDGQVEDGVNWRVSGSAAYAGLSDDVDCWLTVVPLKTHTKVGFNFNRTQISSTAVEKMLELFEYIVETMFHHPEQELGRTPMVSLVRSAPEGLDHGVRGKGLKDSRDLPQCNDSVERLQALWRECLNLHNKSNPIGPDSSFFEVGGDSIAAAQLAVMCGERGLPVELRDIFGHPTLYEQSRIILGLGLELEQQGGPELVFEAMAEEEEE